MVKFCWFRSVVGGPVVFFVVVRLRIFWRWSDIVMVWWGEVHVQVSTTGSSMMVLI